MGMRKPGSNLQGNQNEKKRTPTVPLGGGKNCEVALRRNCPKNGGWRQGSPPRVHSAMGRGPNGPSEPH